MAVLVEAFNVIAKKSAVESKYPGGLSGYIADCPNETFCQDEYLCRIGFGNAEDAEKWAAHLMNSGLGHQINETFQDIAFADSSKGLAAPCEWLVFTQDEVGSMWCFLHGMEMGEKFAHDGWQPGNFLWIDRDSVVSEVPNRPKKWWQFWR